MARGVRGFMYRIPEKTFNCWGFMYRIPEKTFNGWGKPFIRKTKLKFKRKANRRTLNKQVPQIFKPSTSKPATILGLHSL